MPRRKRHTVKRHRRRRHGSVGALKLGGKDSGLKLIALAGGFFLGKQINAAIDKLNTTTTGTPAVSTNRVNPNMLTVGEIGIGGLLLLRKKSPGMLGTGLQVAGGVLAGAGLRRAIGQLGFMNGYQSTPVIGRHRMAGFQSVPVIGQRMPPQLSGSRGPAQLQGFRVNGYTPTGSGVMGSIGSTDTGSGITNSGGGGYMG